MPGMTSSLSCLMFYPRERGYMPAFAGSPSDIRMAATAAAMTAGTAAAAILFALAEIPHDMAQREIECHEKK